MSVCNRSSNTVRYISKQTEVESIPTHTHTPSVYSNHGWSPRPPKCGRKEGDGDGGGGARQPKHPHIESINNPCQGWLEMPKEK